MKQKQVTQVIPEGRVTKTGTEGGVTATVDVGHNSEFNTAVKNRDDRKISTYNEVTVVDYSDTGFDWVFIGQNIETILEETIKHQGGRLAETTIVIADIACDEDSSIGFNILFAVTNGVINALSEL
jgi:hypothetical protein